VQLFWGNYPFAVNGCDLTSRTRVVLSDSGRPVRYVARVAVAGWLEADGQAALSSAEARLRAELATPYRDLRFLTDAGGLAAVSLSNAGSLSGCRVVDGPTFDGRDGAEYATLRRFAFEVEAEYLIANAANAVLSFTETVSITGTGGPVRRLRVPVNATVLVRQQISPRSVVRATQTGQAVGHTRYPAAPAPLWGPPLLLEEQVSVQKGAPKRLGLAFVEFPLSWAYQFESDGPLAGAPGLPPL
jgi:hypothetical protein